jgi:thiol-disulfide isomerase/thioredoxin
MKTTVLAAIVVGAGAAGAAGYLAYERFAATAPATAPLPAVTEAPPAQLAATLPAFQLADRDGQMRSLADWQGKALIVNFWATWCAPCRREIPLLQQIQAEHGAEGFQVIGIAADYRDKVIAYAEEIGLDYPLLIGEQEALDAAASFGVEAIGLPFTVFADKQGRIVAAHLGELTAPEAEVILGAVRRVDGGELTPEQARGLIEAGLAALPPEEPAAS